MIESSITKENTGENETIENKSVESEVVPIEEEVTLEEVKDLAESEKTNFQNETVQEIAELNTVGLSDDMFGRLKDESGIQEQLNTLDQEAVEIVNEIQTEKEENTQELSYDQINQTWNETAKERFGIEGFDLKTFERISYDYQAINEAVNGGKSLDQISLEMENYAVGSNWDQAQKCFDAMQDIEDVAPGSAKRLNEEYGILNFQRYPKEILLNQLNGIDNDKKAGLFAFATFDHNGAFDNQAKIWDKIYQSRKDTTNIRIVESESNIGLVKQAIKMKNDAEEAISLLIMSAHGEADGFVMGEKALSEDGKFDKSLIENTDSDLGKILTQDAVVIANSCSAGELNGWIQTLSKVASIKTVGSETPAAIVDVYVDDNIIVPQYEKQDDYSEYYKGFPMTKKGK